MFKRARNLKLEAFFNILSGLFVELLFVHCYNAPHHCADIDY